MLNTFGRGAIIALAILILTPAAPSVWAQTASEARSAPIAEASPAAQAAPGADTADVLRPGDIIKLTIWREPSFSGEFVVDAEGVAVLPRLGPTPVAGVPTDELRTRLRSELERYLRNPSIEIVFLQRITIHGAVMRAGLYPVDPTMTVLDAVALAGGARHDGRMDRIKLIRGGREIAEIRTAETPVGDLSIRSGDQLFVPELGWFRRNSGLVATGISAMTSLAIALIYITRG
jgi:protein involved in polysaccharide export with SLBB domain